MNSAPKTFYCFPRDSRSWTNMPWLPGQRRGRRGYLTPALLSDGLRPAPPLSQHSASGSHTLPTDILRNNIEDLNLTHFSIFLKWITFFRRCKGHYYLLNCMTDNLLEVSFCGAIPEGCWVFRIPVERSLKVKNMSICWCVSGTVQAAGFLDQTQCICKIEIIVSISKTYDQ